MVRWIYISGISGVILLILRFLGIFLEFSFNSLLLTGSLILLIGICLPLSIMVSLRRQKRIRDIIRSAKRKDTKHPKTNRKVQTKKPKGWDLNHSPFRDRKSGLTWGGGNLYGAKAKRGNKRSLF